MDEYVMACITHTDVIYRCPDCGQVVTMHRAKSRYSQAYMVHNLVMALRDRNKRKDADNYTAVANEWGRWLERKYGD
jgi:hypothetical protein